MKSIKFFLILSALMFVSAGIFAQNPTVKNGVATYHANKNIGRKFKVPDSWDKIVIKANVTVTGSFYFPTRTRPMEIMGESRKTSIIKGDGSRPTNDGKNGRTYSAIRFDKSPNTYIHDLRSLNPMKFHIMGGFGNVKVERCDLIESRGEHSSDGIHGGSVTIDDCYIDTWDDALYLRDCKRVENCTIIHNKNGSPFQISWGGGIGSSNYCLVKNCVVIDAWHKSDYNQGVVSWAQKHDAGQKQTMNIEFVNFKHEVRAGKTRSHMYQFGRRDKRINNAHIKVKGYCDEKNSITWYGGKGNNTISFDCSATTTYTISASAGNGGQISPSGNVKVNKGSNQTFSITANGGYKIKDVKVDNTSIGVKSSYTFNNVTSNHSISATFEPTQTQTYTISASAGANGSITPSGNITVNQGANQSFSIQAVSGYKIADVKVDNTSVGPKASYTFTNVTANHSIYASFKKETGTTTKTVNLTPIHDAFLQGGKGYNINLIRVEPNKRIGYLMFDLSAVDGTIKSAKLKLKCTSDAGSGNIKINLGKSNNWTEKNLNNSNKPAAGAQLAALNQSYKVGSVYTWNLNTSSLSGGGKVSFIATQVSGNDAAFGSKENAANKPVLEITYTTGGGVADCAGVIGGSAYIDDCGDCVGGTTGKEPCVKDCAGVPGGTAYIDDCGECVGGTTGKEPCVPGEKDCAGVVGGTAYIDDCGECVGGTTGKEPCVKDCAGVPGGTAFIDDCGDCVGGTTGKEPCTPGGFDFIDYSAYTVGASHDGNQHDKDDIIAAPMVIALLAQTGLTERFVHMDYSNHLGNNNGNMAKDMATSVNGACDKWGVPKSKTFDCQKNLNGAVNSIKNAINSATAKNRFYYACGGPMEVPWRGIDASNKSNRQNTTAISHSTWNNNHADTPQLKHKWSDIQKTGVKTTKITDQNKNTAFNKPKGDWNWLNAKGGKYAWLFSRNKKSKFDASDAGMVWYIITGRGDQGAKMERVRKVFDGVVVKPKDCAGVPGGTAYIDDCGECVGGTTGKEPCVVGDKDCAGVVGGTAYIDDCGECVGGTTGKEPCVVGEKDCAGVVGGTAYIDDCGECVGGTTGKEPCVIKPKDCAGVPGGTAYIDDCGECVGGTTGKEPCTPGGFDFIDYSAYTVGASHDGNQHDKDDILAAPMIIALLGQTGLSDRFVHMDYSNHLGNNNGNMAKDMATSVNGACDKWGLPKNVTFDCQKNLSGAINSIKNTINSATAKKRFYYACGGPMEVPWRGINASNAANRKNTTVISHSTWNNNHADTPQMNHKWGDIQKTGVKTTKIKDQNGPAFNEPEKDWNWLKAKGGKFAWLFSRNKKGNFDASDAGMVWYIITGRGDQNAQMARVRKVFDGVVVKPKDCAGVPGGTAYIDDCGECVGGTTGKEPCVIGNCTDVTLSAINDFPNFNVNGFVPAYIDKQRGALAVNAAKYKDKWAAATATFNGESATYDITMTSMLETDGECSYKVKVNGKVVGTYQNIPTKKDYTLYTKTFKGVQVSKGATIQVEFNTHTNKTIPEGNGWAYARGRWTKVEFVCVGTSDCSTNIDPVVTLSAPASVKEGFPIALTANVTDENMGKVEFYRGNKLVATATSAPYKATVTAGAPGVESFYAKAIDKCNGEGTSDTKDVTVTKDGGQNCDTYTEIAGLVVMEAENTKSPLGKWKKVSSVNGYSGTGHIEFTGNKPSSGPATSPLTYTFTINQAGDYRLLLRAHKRLAGAASDHCNDAYVKVTGDYTAGAGSAAVNILKSNTKFFGGAAGGWGWAQQLDVNHKKYAAIYKFKAGKTYTLTISGRSQRFNIDRILFYKTSIPMDQAKAASKETKDCRKSQFEQESLAGELTVYPNPASHTVNFDVNGTTDVKVFNMQGKLVYSKVLNSTTTISTSELGNAGLYFIKANNQSYKLIIE